MPTENSESGNLTTRAPKFNENISEKDHNKRIQKRIHRHQQRNREEKSMCYVEHNTSYGFSIYLFLTLIHKKA